MDKYKKILAISVQNHLEYKFNFISQFLYSLIPFGTNLLLWTALYGANPNNMGMSLKEMVVYYCFVLVIENLVTNELHRIMADQIKNGTLSRFLITPCNYHLYHVCKDMSRNLLYLGFFCVPVIVFISVLNVKFEFYISFSTWGVFVLALVMGTIINILINFILGTFAFFLTEVFCLFISIDVLKGMLMGTVFPISLMPEGLYRILVHTPFQFVCYFPAMILLGKYNTSQMAYNFSVGIIWVIVLAFAARHLWKIGLDKYSAAGG